MKRIKWYYSLIISAAFLLFLSGFSKSNKSGSSLYTPTSSDVTSTASLSDLQTGRTLYINNCNACHGLYSPDDYTPSQWKSILSNMGPRTSMSSTDISLVTKYVSRGK
jgi:mono/diheme cytochrome c family protein